MDPKKADMTKQAKGAPKGQPKPKAPPVVNPDDVLLTVAEVAALDKVSERSVRDAIKRGELKEVRVGPGRRMVRISKKDHQDYRAGR